MICLNCEVYFDRNDGGKFCSLSCSTKYNNSTRKYSISICQCGKEYTKTYGFKSRCIDCTKAIKRAQIKSLNISVEVTVRCACGSDFTYQKKKYQKTRKMCNICVTKRRSTGGRSQSLCKRSKNEILFSNLCSGYFESVVNNEKMFDGWDADVILVKEKVAVLWNGQWHYKNVKGLETLHSVQKRDRLKIAAIRKLGFEPYIVKDMGKYNPKFVKMIFDEFCEHVSKQLSL